MAYPTVISTSGGILDTAATQYTIETMPSGEGGGLLVLISYDGNRTPVVDTVYSGSTWELLHSNSYSGIIGGYVFWKPVAEGNDKLRITLNGAETFAHMAFRLDNAANIFIASTSGTGTNSINAELSGLPIATDVLAIVCRAGDATAVPTEPPVGFANMESFAGAGLSSVNITSAYTNTRETFLAPSAWTSSNEQAVTFTIGIISPDPGEGPYASRWIKATTAAVVPDPSTSYTWINVEHILQNTSALYTVPNHKSTASEFINTDDSPITDYIMLGGLFGSEEVPTNAPVFKAEVKVGLYTGGSRFLAFDRLYITDLNGNILSNNLADPSISFSGASSSFSLSATIGKENQNITGLTKADIPNLAAIFSVKRHSGLSSVTARMIDAHVRFWFEQDVPPLPIIPRYLGTKVLSQTYGGLKTETEFYIGSQDFIA